MMTFDEAITVCCDSKILSSFLPLADVVRLSICCQSMCIFREQLSIQMIDGCMCNSMKALNRYLKQVRGQAHIHVKLYFDEVDNIDQYLCPLVTKTLLLQPCVMNWHPYAICRKVSWLQRYTSLEHLELSLNAQSAVSFVSVLRLSMFNLKALVVCTNHPTSGFWTSLTHLFRPSLVCLCVNNFLLENILLENINAVKFLWVSRPTKRRGHAGFLQRVCESMHDLVYLSTVEFKGFSQGNELEAWLCCLGGKVLPRLKYWDLHESDLMDIGALTRHLSARLIPLTVQGLHAKEACLHVAPSHRLLSGVREVSLHIPRIYRSLGILGHVVHTRIRTPCGFVYLRGRNL